MFLGTLGIKECMLHNWVKGSNHGLPKTTINSYYDNNSCKIIDISELLLVYDLCNILKLGLILYQKCPHITVQKNRSFIFRGSI